MAHFEVIDLGVDVKPDRFVYAVRIYRPDVLLMSGVLTLAQDSMARTMRLLEQEGLRKQTPVMVGETMRQRSPVPPHRRRCLGL